MMMMMCVGQSQAPLNIERVYCYEFHLEKVGRVRHSDEILLSSSERSSVLLTKEQQATGMS